jgi:Ser/Thr protein kinase RdoA (MazF antagonist)
MDGQSTIDNVDVESIFSHYDVGALDQVEALTAGTVQTNLLLNTTQGRFVLRYYEQNRSLESVLFEVNLINYLKRHSYPCPGVVRNVHRRLAALYKDRPFALFEFVEGTHIEHPTERQKQQLIQKAAELQNVTRHYRPFYAQFRWNYGVELCETLAEAAANRIATPNALQKLMWYKQALSELVLPASLPKGICHCDFHFSNVLFKDGEFQALLDFDDANYTFLTFDLAYLIEPFISSFRWDTWENFAPRDEVFDFAEARKIVSAYQQHRALNSTEKKYLFDVFKLGIFVDSLWYFQRGEAHDFFERRKIAYMDALGRETFRRELFDGPS